MIREPEIIPGCLPPDALFIRLPGGAVAQTTLSWLMDNLGIARVAGTA